MQASCLALVLSLFIFSHESFAKKDPKLTPEEQAELERQRKKDKREGVKWGVAPIANFTTDSGFTLGVLSQRFDYGKPGRRPYDNLLTMQLSYATEGAKSALLAFEKTAVDIEGQRLRLGFSLVVLNNPFAAYYGVGDTTPYSALLASQGFYSYTLNVLAASATARKELGKDWELIAGISPTYFQARSLRPASQFALDFNGVSFEDYNTKFIVGALLDRRDSEFITSKGDIFSTQFTFSPGFMGTLDTYFRYSVDYRHYFPLIDDRWLWLAGQVQYAVVSSAAPFTEKLGLGSAGTVRGLRANRYLVNHRLTYRLSLRSVIIRWRIFDFPLKAGMGVFTDMGRIGDNFGRIFKGQNHASWGLTFFGSYFHDDFLGHFDLGFSEEGTAVYVGLGHTF